MIKTYEDYKEIKNIQWRVKLEQPYFELSLHKIGMNKDDINVYMKYFKELKYNYNNYIFFGFEFDDVGGVENVFHNQYQFSSRFKFMGDVKITSKEIAIWEYKNDVKKYNL
jgi:hypothetical protein